MWEVSLSAPRIKDNLIPYSTEVMLQFRESIFGVKFGKQLQNKPYLVGHPQIGGEKLVTNFVNDVEQVGE
jgi:hypothetical protein